MRARILTLMEWLAVMSLMGTQEIPWTVAFVWGLLWFLKSSLSFRFTDRAFVPILAIGAIALVSFLSFHNLHPLSKAGIFVPLLQSLLWWSDHQQRQEALRLSLSLMGLLIAAAITPEFYLFFVIVCFMFLASLFLAVRHYEKSTNKKNAQLPKGYLVHTAIFSFFVLALTALIFPLIPKNANLNSHFNSQTEVSYTENVDLSSWKKINGDGQGNVVLRVFYQGETLDMHRSLYFGLLRTRVLDQFDGTQWKATNYYRQDELFKPIKDQKLSSVQKIGLEILREEIASDRLPVPYGTSSVWTENNSGFTGIIRNGKSEWEVPGTNNQKVKYQLILAPNDVRAHYELWDTPRKANLEVPSAIQNGKIKKLADRVFANARTPEEKVQAVRIYFYSEGFKAYDTNEKKDSAPLANLSRFSVMERFVFFEKEGHCELFSSTAAVLLRLAGVPTRLISGFRISRDGMAGVVNVRSGDAHAWLEAWTSRGWVVLDPTPRIMAPGSFFTKIQSVYELMGAYWTGFVINDSKSLVFKVIDRLKSVRWKEEGESFFHWIGLVLEENLWVLAAAIAVLVVGFFLVISIIKIYFPHVFSIHYRVRQGPRVLRERRKKFDRWARKSAGELGARWLVEYERLRFGSQKVIPSQEELARLDEIFKKLKSA